MTALLLSPPVATTVAAETRIPQEDESGREPYTFDLFNASNMQYLSSDEGKGSLLKAGFCDGDSMVWACLSAFYLEAGPDHEAAGAELMVFADVRLRHSLTPYLGYGPLLGIRLNDTQPAAGLFVEAGVRYTFSKKFQAYVTERFYETTLHDSGALFSGFGIMWNMD